MYHFLITYDDAGWHREVINSVTRDICCGSPTYKTLGECLCGCSSYADRTKDPITRKAAIDLGGATITVAV